MPTVSSFSGITIRMYFNDHVPPHFHAEYGDDEVLVDIEALDIYAGDLPKRALRVVLAWATLRQEELRVNWLLARAGHPLNSIAP